MDVPHIAEIAQIFTPTNLMRFIVYIFTLSLLVYVHEWGHYIVARKSGVGVREFALGFGPALFSRKSQKTGTVYRFNAIPLGGYCAMTGEDGASRSPGEGVTGGPFTGVSPWHRLAIVLAGPAVNIVFAFLVLWTAGVTVGTRSEAVSTTVGKLKAGYPAEAAGLRTGDVIEKIDGRVITDGSAMLEQIHLTRAKAVMLTYRRGSDEKTVRVATRSMDVEGKPMTVVGFTPLPEFERLGPLQSADSAKTEIGSMIEATVSGLGGAIHGNKEAVDGLSGPVGMARAAVAIQDYGIQAYLSFVALISLSLGIFNLLPIPALDGGRAIFVLAELIIRRPIDPEKEAMVHLTGFAAILLLVVFVTWRDIMHFSTALPF